LNEIDYLHLYPAPPRDLSIDDHPVSPASINPPWSSLTKEFHFTGSRTLHTAWYFYLAEIALHRILHSLLVWRYGAIAGGEPLDRHAKDHLLQQNVIEFDRQIQEW
jgi:hypothetical protein